MGASDDLKSTTGLYDPSLGASSNERSGRAILARQQQSNTGTFLYVDNLARAIRYITRDIVGPNRLNMSITGGTYGQIDTKVSGSMVITDSIYVGAAVAYLPRDGYGEIVDGSVARPYNYVGQDVSDKDVLAARGTVAFVWGEDSRLQIMADTVQDNSNAVGGKRLNNVLAPALG